MDKTLRFTGEHPVHIQEIKDKVDVIAKKYRPEKIMLFGSYAKGRPSSGSDVDLLVIMQTNQPTLELASEISQTLKHTFPMDILVRTPQDIARRLEQGDFFIRDILENGIVLYERTG